LAHLLLGAKEISFDVETDTLRGNLLGMSFYVPEGDVRAYIPFKPHGNMSLLSLDVLQPIFEDKTKTFVGHNIKYDMQVLEKYGIVTKGKLWDTFIASWLVDESWHLDLKTRVRREFDAKVEDYSQIVGKGHKKKALVDVPVYKVAKYCMDDSYWSWRLKDKYIKILEKKELLPIFENMYIPFVRVILGMERVGIKVDIPQLNMLQRKLGRKIIKYTKRIYDLAGQKFNVGSTQQLGKILFDKMKLRVMRRSEKTGVASTDVDTLETLAENGSNISKIVLKYREVTKLMGTYALGLRQFLDKNNRVHTSFKVGGTITGRLASSDPNLQNIPIKTKLGKEIRKCFIAENGYKLIISDYANVELRILAHFSKDQNMVNSFLNNEDLHSRTAADLFDMPLKQVSKDSRERRIAKTINFGLMYGMGPWALAQQLGIDDMEAKAYHEKYFDTVFPEINPWKQQVLNYCRKNGYVKTIIGRRRNIPDINYASDIHSIEQFKRKYGTKYKIPETIEKCRMTDQKIVIGRAERQAINSKIQGSASDIITLSMLRIDNEIALGSPKKDFRMLLQIHDELVNEVIENKVEKYIPDITECMQHPITGKEILRVPLIIETLVVDKWGDAK